MTNLEALVIGHRIQRRLLLVNQAIDLAQLKEKDMAVSPVVADLIAKFDVATDKIAARIQALINAGTLSPEDQAALQGEVDKLNLLGQDPNNPVPPAIA